MLSLSLSSLSLSCLSLRPPHHPLLSPYPGQTCPVLLGLMVTSSDDDVAETACEILHNTYAVDASLHASDTCLRPRRAAAVEPHGRNWDEPVTRPAFGVAADGGSRGGVGGGVDVLGCATRLPGHHSAGTPRVHAITRLESGPRSTGVERGDEEEAERGQEVDLAEVFERLLLLAHALLRRARQVMLKTCVPEMSNRDN